MSGTTGAVVGGCPHAATLGEQYAPTDTAFAQQLHQFYARARRDESVTFMPELNLWLVSRYDDIAAVMKDPTRFSSAAAADPPAEIPAEVQEILRQGFPHSLMMIGEDPPAHQRVRALAGAAFSPRRVALMEPAIRALVNAMIDELRPSGAAELIGQFLYPLPMMVILDLIGIPRADMDQIKAWHGQFLLAIFVPGLPLDQRMECARGAVAYQHYLADLIEDRRAAPRDDFLSELVQARAAGAEPLSTPELVWLLGFFVSAGHETTSHMIGNTLLALLQNPAQWQDLADDPALIPAAIEEGCRIEAPFLPARRITTVPVELGGVSLPQGATLALLLGSGNRDEAVYDAPDAFDLHRRFPRPHLGFGFGIHYCLGAPLGRLEGVIALEALRTRLPNLRLAPGFAPAFAPHFFFRGLSALEVAWDAA